MRSPQAFALARLRLAAALAAGVVAFGAGFGAGRASRAPSPEVAVVVEAHERIRELALRPPRPGAMAREAVKGMLRALDDPFAEYLGPREGREEDDDLERRALGLGPQALRQAAGIRARVLGPGIGYVGVRLLAPHAAALVRAEVRRLQRLGVRGLVLDLRGCPGGLVEEAVELGAIFLGERTVFRYQAAGGGEGERSGRGEPVGDLALVVLVDRRTASAAELVAGAVQDYGRGLVVGERTRGKASVQRVVGLSDGSAIKLTTAVYRTPKGRSVAGEGIAPDVVVPGGPGDPQLQRAQAILQATSG